MWESVVDYQMGAAGQIVAQVGATVGRWDRSVPHARYDFAAISTVGFSTYSPKQLSRLVRPLQTLSWLIAGIQWKQTFTLS